MGRAFELVARIACRFVASQTIRKVIFNADRVKPWPAPFIIACTHVAHLEPFILGTTLNRRVDWMARKEFYRHPIFAAMLRGIDAFPVNRQGIPVLAIRTAIQRLNNGRVVGIFPEGGVKVGAEAAFRGGPIKAGACVIARRARVPILPVVMLGTEKLSHVEPWLPMRRGRVWMNFGNFVEPILNEPRRRVARAMMCENLSREFMRTYRELLQACNFYDATAAP
jgi:1-acyl-sn-glycerol-3-phosphate acyltransferase